MNAIIWGIEQNQISPLSISFLIASLFTENIISSEKMHAGESEIVSWCDNSASADEIAYSLLGQSEHSKGCLAIMLSKDLNLIKDRTVNWM